MASYKLVANSQVSLSGSTKSGGTISHAQNLHLQLHTHTFAHTHAERRARTRAYIHALTHGHNLAQCPIHHILDHQKFIKFSAFGISAHLERMVSKHLETKLNTSQATFPTVSPPGPPQVS